MSDFKGLDELRQKFLSIHKLAFGAVDVTDVDVDVDFQLYVQHSLIPGNEDALAILQEADVDEAAALLRVMSEDKPDADYSIPAFE